MAEERSRCDNTESDLRVDAETCRHLKIRSIAAAPIRYERDVVGLVEVFSPQTFAFDEGDLRNPRASRPDRPAHGQPDTAAEAAKTEAFACYCFLRFKRLGC